MSLKEYRRKRKFSETPEPPPRAKSSAGKGPLRFVIQKHDASRTHYDFRLEMGGALKSWAVPRGPTLTSHDPRLAVLVEDHPLEYGSFEGVIPRGNYGAGTVMIWDAGTYTERNSTGRKDSETALKDGLGRGHITFVLEGKKLRGEFALVRIKKKGAPPNGWLLIKKHDKHASRQDVLRLDRSIASRRSMEQIAGQAEKKGEIWMPRQGRVTTTAEKPPITHPKKIYWPTEGYTKGDLIEYYDTIADTILPHLVDRPQSLHRQPAGVRNAGFFHKDLSGFVPRRLQTVRIFSSSSNRTINYALCQDRWSLLYLANLGCIELNPWLSRRQNLDTPDLVVIDLDPDGNPFNEVVKVALEVHKVLKSIKVQSFCKTSGASGLHICIPTNGKCDYDTGRAFAENVCRVVQQKFPNLTSMERNPARRRKKIYLDYLQNRRGATLAAAYCVRPRPKATVSAPLKWTEVKPGLRPDAFTIKTMPRRIAMLGDLWKPMLRSTVNVEAATRRLLKRFHI